VPPLVRSRPNTSLKPTRRILEVGPRGTTRRRAERLTTPTRAFRGLLPMVDLHTPPLLQNLLGNTRQLPGGFEDLDSLPAAPRLPRRRKAGSSSAARLMTYMICFWRRSAACSTVSTPGGGPPSLSPPGFSRRLDNDNHHFWPVEASEYRYVDKGCASAVHRFIRYDLHTNPSKGVPARTA
jgi:hypothetical protein